jgi:hypothetical protein
MILRRITEHVKAQNWFAVGLDFVIVVTGVFVGLQVGNWNAAAQNRAKEAVVLEQLAVEFSSAVDLAKEARASSDMRLDATRDVLRVIREGTEPEDKAAFLKTLGYAGSLDSGPSEPVTLVELVSAGGLSDLSSPELRAALIRYHETAIQQDELASLILARVSSPHDGFHDAIYANPDYPDSSDILLDRYDWELIPATRQQFQVILYGKLGLSYGLEEQIVRGEAVLAEIEKARK